MNEVVIIVDAFSSGALLATECIKRGFQCISVLSNATLPPVFKASYRRQDFINEFIDQGNLENLVQSLKQYKVLAVMPGAETGIYLADQLADALGVLGNPLNTSLNRRNKFLMGEAIKRAGLRHIRQYIVNSRDEFMDWIESNEIYPLVLKPTGSAGSDGVFIAQNKDEAIASFNKIYNTSNILLGLNKEVLLQEFIRGDEYVLDCASYDGNHVVCNIFKYRKTSANGSNVVYRALVPITGENELTKTLTEYNKSALSALDIVFGASHSEIILSPDGPVLVEVGARLHGGQLPAIIQRLANWSQTQITVDSYLSKAEFEKKVASPLQYEKNMLVHFAISFQTGIVEDRPVKDELASLPSFFDALWNRKEGQELGLTHDLNSCPLRVILAHGDLEQIDSDVNRLIEYEQTNKLFTTSYA